MTEQDVGNARQGANPRHNAQGLKLGSLFSGIGGLELGLERAGMTVRWQVEIDPWCRQVLACHWPDATRYTDVRAIDWNEVQGVDVICGGFPCQPVSEAGSRRAQDDERWLWPEFARCIGVLRPRYVVVENVSGLLTANRGLAMGDVLGGLADLGYDAEWSVVTACSMGAPHTRERVFVVAYPHSGGQQASRVSGNRHGQAVAQGRTGAEHLHAPTVVGRGSGGSTWPVEPDVGRMADGLSPDLDRRRLRALGNAVAPAVAEWIGRRVVAHNAALAGSTDHPEADTGAAA